MNHTEQQWNNRLLDQHLDSFDFGYGPVPEGLDPSEWYATHKMSAFDAADRLPGGLVDGEYIDFTWEGKNFFCTKNNGWLVLAVLEEHDDPWDYYGTLFHDS